MYNCMKNMHFIALFRVERVAQRCFREFFSILRLFSDVVITFLLECVHFLVFHILRKLLCGLLFTVLSALSGPVLTECYNIMVWPLALCCFHTCNALKLVLSPCWTGLGWTVGKCVDIAGACRLVQVNTSCPPHPQQTIT